MQPRACAWRQGQSGHGCTKCVTNGCPVPQNSLVMPPSNPLVDEWGRSRRVRITKQVLSRRNALTRRHARRMSRSFAGVGVSILPARLRQLSAGAAFANGELTEIKFALIATEIRRQQHHAKFERGRRRFVRWLLVAGLVLVALNLLISMEYVFLSVTEQLPPY